MDFPAGILVPDESGAMSEAGNDVQLAIAIHVGRQDVGGAGMFSRQEMFLERPGGILARLPPGEPLALAGLVRGSALGRKGDVEPAGTLGSSSPEMYSWGYGARWDGLDECASGLDEGAGTSKREGGPPPNGYKLRYGAAALAQRVQVGSVQARGHQVWAGHAV